MLLALWGCGSEEDRPSADPSSTTSTPSEVTTSSAPSPESSSTTSAGDPDKPDTGTETTPVPSQDPAQPPSISSPEPPPLETQKPLQPTTPKVPVDTGPVIAPGGPTLDNAYPDFDVHSVNPGETGNPHCLVLYNRRVASGVRVHEVAFSSRPPGSLTYDAANTDPACGTLPPPPGPGVAPSCRGRTLPPVTKATDGGCVIRINVTDPGSDANRVGTLVVTLRARCSAPGASPCDRLPRRPTPAHPVTVQWRTAPFYVSACGNDWPGPPTSAQIADLAKGRCPPDQAPGSP